MASLRDSLESESHNDAVLCGDLSVRDKSLMKRNINKHHNNNLSAGYVPVHEEDLHKTGLRGRKTYLFWTAVGLLSVLALANLVLLLAVVRVLRIGTRMENIEIIPELVKFYGKTDLGNIYKEDGMIEGYGDEPLIISGVKSQLAFDINPHTIENSRRVMTIDHNQTVFQNVQSFNVKDMNTGKDIFSTINPSLELPTGIKHLHVDFATTSRVAGPVNENLVVKSDSYLRFKGNEGTRIEARAIQWSADKFLSFKSINGSIIINGTRGVTIDMNRMPEASGVQGKSQFKVCVCMPSGKLFRVKVLQGHSSHSACKRVDSRGNDPCKSA